jgi:hypothetical protein
MCQATVYLVEDGQEEELMRDEKDWHHQPKGGVYRIQIYSASLAPLRTTNRSKRVTVTRHYQRRQPI